MVSLASVVDQLAPMLRRLTGEAVEFRLALDASPGRVRAERSQLEQLLLNLVVNARDAMPRGGILEVAVECGGDEVRLRVTDNGSGMDPATRAHIFEPFFTTKGAGRGTGLGLVVVAEVARRAGARWTWTATPGSARRSR